MNIPEKGVSPWARLLGIVIQFSRIVQAHKHRKPRGTSSATSRVTYHNQNLRSRIFSAVLCSFCTLSSAADQLPQKKKNACLKVRGKLLDRLSSVKEKMKIIKNCMAIWYFELLCQIDWPVCGSSQSKKCDFWAYEHLSA